jgi:Na+-translocating ferredoxin:NAD+ oxidoreductase subunit D
MTHRHSRVGGNTSTPSVTRVMAQVLTALVPGILTHVWLFGPGIVVSLVLCSVFGLAFEAAVLRLRRYPIKPFLSDGTTLVTAALLALTLPTLMPWWIYAVGMLFAIVVAKHLYGGLGQNTFNPAMLGFAVLIVSFPAQINAWPAPLALAANAPSLSDILAITFGGFGGFGDMSHLSPDAYTEATPLDSLKAHLRAGHDAASLLGHNLIPTLAARDLVALAYLIGGVYLLAQRIITWHIPIAFLAGMGGIAGLLYLIDPTASAGPLFHLLIGGSLLGAFFIATDPVSAANTPLGKILYAGLAGILVVLIRSFGSFPDGIAFAVLIMNAAAPLIDAYTQPKVFGHSHRRRPGDTQ